jgi:hypothetical protein
MAGTQPKELAELELVVMRGFWDDGPGTTTKARQQPDANQSKLWDVLPGRSGYWRLNVDAALQHPVIGQWLNQADTLFLTPGWKMVARDEARDRRAELGLSLKNVASISGSVNMQTKMIDKAETDHDFHTSVTTNEFVMRMRRDDDCPVPCDERPYGNPFTETDGNAPQGCRILRRRH